MPRRTKADERKPRPDRPRPTDAAPRSPKNFKLAVVALTAIALGATFFSGWLLWRGPVGDLVRQYRLMQNPPWRSSDEAIRAALAGNPEADRMLAALSALTTTELILSGRIEVGRLPSDLKAALGADWSNRVTRLCAATLASTQARAAGGDATRQAAAFRQAMDDGPIDRCTLYRDQWWEAWSAALSKSNVGAAAYKPGFQAMLTPSASITAAPIGALPRIADQCTQLSSTLTAASASRDAAAVSGAIDKVLRTLVDNESSVANLLLAIDTLVRLAPTTSPKSAQQLRLARDKFRMDVAYFTSDEPDWLDATRQRVQYNLAITDAILFMPTVAAAGAALAVAMGASLSAAVVLIRALTNKVDRTLQQNANGPLTLNWQQCALAFAFGVIAAIAISIVVAIRVRADLRLIDTWFAIAFAGSAVAGFSIAQLASVPQRTRFSRTLVFVMLIACVVVPLASSNILILSERFIRSHALLVILGIALGIAMLILRRRRSRVAVTDSLPHSILSRSFVRAGFFMMGAFVVSTLAIFVISTNDRTNYMRDSFRRELRFSVGSGPLYEAQRIFGLESVDKAIVD